MHYVFLYSFEHVISYRTDKLVIDGHTDPHTDRQNQAMTISEGSNWPRVKTEDKGSLSFEQYVTGVNEGMA